MATIVFMDHDEGAFNPNSLGVLAKAASLGGEVTAFVGGSGIDDAWAGGLGAYGASKVLVADDAALAGLPQPLVDALEPHAREADAVLFGAGVVSADVAAGLAARVGSGINCETTDFTLGEAARSRCDRRWATPGWSSRPFRRPRRSAWGARTRLPPSRPVRARRWWSGWR
jgi:electron transfer flavoprotein alpha subunit